MASIHCGKCSQQLRKQLGLHTLGEPYIESDGDGPYLQCPECGHKNRLSSERQGVATQDRPDR